MPYKNLTKVLTCMSVPPSMGHSVHPSVHPSIHSSTCTCRPTKLYILHRYPSFIQSSIHLTRKPSGFIRVIECIHTYINFVITTTFVYLMEPARIPIDLPHDYRTTHKTHIHTRTQTQTHTNTRAHTRTHTHHVDLVGIKSRKIARNENRVKLFGSKSI